MLVKICALASLPHYRNHIEPVMAALPEDMRGAIYDKPDQLPDDTTPIVVAGFFDLKRVRTRRPIVFLEHGAGQTYCLVPSTRVLTADLRWRPIGEMRVGDQLVAFEEERTNTHSRQWQQATVESVDTIIQPCYLLKFSDGTEITASADHRWLTRDRQMFGWSRTADLQGADRYPKRSSKMVKLMETWDEDVSWGAGYLAAAYDGEGCFTQTSRKGRQNRMMLVFSQKDNAMLELVQSELRDRKFEFSVRCPDTRKGVAQLSILGGLPEVLRFLGSVRPRRLLSNMKPLTNGRMGGRPVELLSSEFIGDREVMAVKTSTGTLVAEGFASHNSGDPNNTSRHACYSGSLNSTYRRVNLFLCPSETVARRWREVQPRTPAVAVGCPRLDRWHANPQPPSGETTIGWTWHWGAEIGVPEATGALRYYRDHLPEIVASLSADGYKVIGHAHPRLGTSIEAMWLDAGATWTADPDDLFEQAACLVADNTSLMYEFASLDRPVVALNAPWYRRRIEHGLRFWSAVPGPQADTPGEVADTIRLALDDPPEIAAHRRDVTKMVYGRTDGLAASRAAAAIVATLG